MNQSPRTGRVRHDLDVTTRVFSIEATFMVEVVDETAALDAAFKARRAHPAFEHATEDEFDHDLIGALAQLFGGIQGGSVPGIVVTGGNVNATEVG